MKIPKIIHQIWVGPLPEPVRWTRTWQKMNPGWEYRMWGNADLLAGGWRNQHVIDHYLAQCRSAEASGEFTNASGSVFTGEKAVLFAWHVIADVLRYEILLRHGGFMPGADTECVRPIPEDAFEEAEVYAVNTGHHYAEHRRKLEAKIATGSFGWADAVRLKRYDPLACAPVMAAVAGHPFLELAVEELGKVPDSGLGEAVDTTGNVFMAKLIREHPERMRGFVVRPYLKERESAEAGAWRVHHSGTTLNRYRYAR